MRAIVHIGLEKTGTTSIQRFLTINNAMLKRKGIWVCESQHPGNNFHLAMASFSAYRNDSLLRTLGIESLADFEVFTARQRRLLKAEVSAATKSGADTFVISSEHLQSRLTSPADLARLKEILYDAGLTNVEIVVYFRSPLRIALSHHGMAIKKGVHIDGDALLPGNPRVSHILDFDKFSVLWPDCFGASAINARLYPEGEGSEAVFRDFTKVIGVSESFDEFTIPERANTNLSEDALLVLNAVNRTSKVVANQWKTRELFNLLEVTAAGKGLSASTELVDAYETAYRGPIDRLQRRYFPNTADQLFRESAGTATTGSHESAIEAGAAVLVAALELLDRKTTAKPKGRLSRLQAIVRRNLKRLF